jgi:hypothetical protein
VSGDRVVTQAVPLGKRLGAQLTDEGLLARVRALVSKHLANVRRRVATKAADVGHPLDVRVPEAVTFPHVVSLVVPADRLSKNIKNKIKSCTGSALLRVPSELPVRLSNLDRRDPKIRVFLQGTEATPCEHLLK